MLNKIAYKDIHLGKWVLQKLRHSMEDKMEILNEKIANKNHL